MFYGRNGLFEINGLRSWNSATIVSYGLRSCFLFVHLTFYSSRKLTYVKNVVLRIIYTYFFQNCTLLTLVMICNASIWYFSSDKNSSDRQYTLYCEVYFLTLTFRKYRKPSNLLVRWGVTCSFTIGYVHIYICLIMLISQNKKI